jgi:acetyl esterase/lipase
MSIRETTEIYKKTLQGDLVIKIYQPSPLPAEKLPAIVFYYGGGWAGGNIDQFQEHCRYLVSRGMISMCAEYRIASKHRTTPVECVKDGRSAMRWARQNAGRLGIDPDRLCAGGGSAGGHVAACTLFCDQVDDETDDLSVSCVPAAFVLFNPVIDTVVFLKRVDRFGGEENARKYSPVHHVSEGTPPVLIQHGQDDDVVFIEDERRFRDRMTELGNSCKLVEYEGKGHGWFNYMRDEDNMSYILTVRVMDEFLAELGFLEGKPEI